MYIHIFAWIVAAHSRSYREFTLDNAHKDNSRQTGRGDVGSHTKIEREHRQTIRWTKDRQHQDRQP